MKLKIDTEERTNVITGKVSNLQRIFKKVNEGLSEGSLKKMEIFEDKIKLYIGETQNETNQSK